MTHGMAYAALRFYMSSPTPLDPKFTWQYFTRKQAPFIQSLIDAYPFPFQRPLLMARLLNQSHAKGIEYHYDVSNEFYKLFLDRDFMFYSCADFASGQDSLETAQRRKADHLLSLIAPVAGNAAAFPGEPECPVGRAWKIEFNIVQEIVAVIVQDVLLDPLHHRDIFV